MTMRAAVLDRFGADLDLRDVAKPEAAEGRVLIAGVVVEHGQGLRAGQRRGLHPGELRSRRGGMHGWFPRPSPYGSTFSRATHR
jgi:hypothetical protein